MLALKSIYYLAIAAIWLAVLTSCGGGGGASSAPPAVPIPPGPQTTETRWAGFYGDDARQLADTRSFVNIVWVAGWLDPAGRPLDQVIVERAAAACAAGKLVVLMLPGVYDGTRFNPASIPLARGILSALGPLGRACVYALYPIDEPDIAKRGIPRLRKGISPLDIKTANTALRALMAEFPELRATKLAVIYAGANDFPGLASYDLISFDDYNAGEGVLGDPLEALLGLLQPHQRAFLTVGVADPWRAPLGPFLARLLADPRIIGVLGFIFIDNAAPGVGLGVRSNGTRPAVCAAFITITAGTCP